MGLPEKLEEMKTSLEMYMNSEVAITCASGEFVGVFAGINYNEKEVYLSPFIDWDYQRKGAIISNGLPIALAINNFGGERAYSITPKPNGYMQSIVDNSARGLSVGFGNKKKNEGL